MIVEAYSKKILKTIGIELGMQVGDFGCGGRGTFTFAAAQVVGDEGKVYAVDVSKVVLKSINDQVLLDGFDQVETVWSNLEKYQATNIEDGSLDIGLLVNVLFQTDKPSEIIKESMRMIKDGGIFFISDWLNDSHVSKTELKYLRSVEEIKQLASELGLKLINEIQPWESHFGLVFRK